MASLRHSKQKRKASTPKLFVSTRNQTRSNLNTRIGRSVNSSNELECIGDGDLCSRPQQNDAVKFLDKDKSGNDNHNRTEEENRISTPDFNIYESFAIISLILKNLDHKDILRLRGISHRWNYQACANLIRTSVARLHTKRRLKLFLALIHRKNTLGLPFPIRDLILSFSGTFAEFQQIETLFQSRDSPDSEKTGLISQFEFSIVELNLEFKSAVTPGLSQVSQDQTAPENWIESDKARHFLWRNSKKLERLAISLDVGCAFGCQVKPSSRLRLVKSRKAQRPFVIPFPSLKQLSYNDENELLHTIDNAGKGSGFLVSLINSSPILSSLSVSCANDQVLLKVLREVKPEALQSLSHLSSSVVTAEHVADLTSVSIPTGIRGCETLKLNLTTIRLENLVHKCTLTFETFQNFVNSVSEKLEQLIFNCRVTMTREERLAGVFPFCPQLKMLELKQWNTGSLEAFSSKNIPKLEKLSLENFYGFGSVLCLHQGVTDLYLKINRNHAHIESELLFNILSTRFPSLTGLFVCTAADEWNTGDISNVVKFFPKIRRIFLGGSGAGEYDQEEFTGLPSSTNHKGRAFKRDSWSKLNQKRSLPSLINLECLESLDLSMGPQVSNIIIRRGLALIPNLKALAFNCTLYLTTDVLQTYLNHLSLLVIPNGRKVFSAVVAKDLCRRLKVRLVIPNLKKGSGDFGVLDSYWNVTLVGN